MTRKTYHWVLINTSNEGSVERYCHNCGRKVIFTDSMKRRRNANGKTIHEYAIYKCEKDHTWNLPLSTYKALNDVEHHEVSDSVQKACSYEFLNLMDLRNEEVKEIEIILEEVSGRWRTDKLLGDRIRDLSRSKVCELIRLEKILLDGKAVKQDSLLKKQQIITISLDGLFADNIPVQP